jgi:biotin carboxylase
VRIVVAAGEAMVTKTARNPRVLAEVHKLLSLEGWYGPLVIQVIDGRDGAYLIECNPRFGSGAPCSIEAGLDMPRWIIREALGRPLPPGPIEWRDGLCMTRSRRDHFLWLSS